MSSPISMVRMTKDRSSELLYSQPSRSASDAGPAQRAYGEQISSFHQMLEPARLVAKMDDPGLSNRVGTIGARGMKRQARMDAHVSLVQGHVHSANGIKIHAQDVRISD